MTATPELIDQSAPVIPDPAPPPAEPSRARLERARRRRLLARVKLAAGITVGVGLVVAIVLAWIPEPVKVELAVVTRGPMEVTVNEDGRTRVRDRYQLSAPLAATLVRPVLRAGDVVRRGEVVARLIPASFPLLDSRARSEADARVAAALAAKDQATSLASRSEAEFAHARQEAERRRALFAGGAIAREELESYELAAETARQDLARARSGVEVAQAEVAVARAALLRISGAVPAGLDRFDLRAPVSGKVLRVWQESEAVVQSGTPLLELGDPGSLEIVVDVLSADAVEIVPGAAVAVTQWGGEQVLHGRVRRLEPSGFTRLSALGVEEQRVNVIVDPDSTDAGWKALADGYRVETRIQVWKATQVLWIPAGAVFRHRNSWAVYLREAGRARLRPVTIGRRNDAQAQVLAGLEPGEEVILYPGDTVIDGVKVAPR